MQGPQPENKDGFQEDFDFSLKLVKINGGSIPDYIP